MWLKPSCIHTLLIESEIKSKIKLTSEDFTVICDSENYTWPTDLCNWDQADQMGRSEMSPYNIQLAGYVQTVMC